MFGGYPATVLLENEMAEPESVEAIPNIVVTLTWEDDGAVGTNMSGDEVFKTPLVSNAELVERIADALGFHAGAVKLLFDETSPSMAVLSPSIDWTLKFEEERSRRYCESDRLWAMLDELAQQKQHCRKELDAAKREQRELIYAAKG